MKNQFFHDSNPSRQQGILQAIKKQVMAEYELELQRTEGWWKYWTRWKITLIIQIRYRGLLFLGMATRLP